MADKHVDVSVEIDASANQIWARVSDFCAPWHPLVETMTREVDVGGHIIRAFSVQGEDTLYRERLTWYSASKRTMAYTHVAGIDGADRYDAKLSVTEAEQSRATVKMSAQLTAEEPRASDIAAGTKMIFEMGLTSLKETNGTTEVTAKNVTASQSRPLKHKLIGQGPNIAVSYVEGPNSDTLCLFLHGIGGNKSNWTDQLHATAPYCTTAAMDLRGYGDSALGDAPTSVADYCKDIARVMADFGAKKVILCGLSYGAWIATSFALRQPEMLAGLVLAGGCTGMSEASPEAREAFRTARETPLKAGQAPADFAPNVVPVLLGPDATKDVENALLASMSAIPSATYADALRCFTNPPEVFDFSRMSCPVLMMTGEFDTLAPPAEIHNVATRIHEKAVTPDVGFECLARAGHLCNLEAPDAFNVPLIELVKRVAR